MGFLWLPARCRRLPLAANPREKLADPITARQIRTLRDDWGVKDVAGDDGWFEVVGPITKTLACGDTGDGGMTDWKELVQLIEKRMGLEAG